MGYYRAGFNYIVGVDNRPQKRYPFDFIQDDALSYVEKYGKKFDAIHASPPCQAYSVLKGLTKKQHPELIDDTRELLIHTGKPYVIENVVGSPLDTTLILCGTMFGLGVDDAELRRHRLFESSVMLMSPGHCNHNGRTIGIYGSNARDPQLEMLRYRPMKTRVIGVYGEMAYDPSIYRAKQRKVRTKTITVTGSTSQRNIKRNEIRETFTVDEARQAMGIDWMVMSELSQAIPPAYTEWIGRQLMRVA